MKPINNTELILTKENKIYHLNLSREEISTDIIIVGDPGRVSQISNFFDNIEFKGSHREFMTHTGTYNKKRLTVISTGIGTDNIDIVLNELDAIVNVDFESRLIKKEHTKLNIIRIGTSGALQKNINVDSFICGTYGLGFDNLAHFYNHNNIINHEIKKSFMLHSNWPNKLSEPYFVEGSKDLLDKFKDMQCGITATAPGFYGPQGRTIRIPGSIPELHKTLNTFSYNKEKITNFEMETSALYFLSKCLGHNALTICAIIGNRITQEYSKDYKKTINNLILKVLETISK